MFSKESCKKLFCNELPGILFKNDLFPNVEHYFHFIVFFFFPIFVLLTYGLNNTSLLSHTPLYPHTSSEHAIGERATGEHVTRQHIDDLCNNNSNYILDETKDMFPIWLPPVSDKLFDSIYSFNGDHHVKNIMKAIFNNEPVAILVFGGSETGGNSCEGAPTHIQCSWSYRAYNWLKQTSGNNNLYYENLARGGTTSISIMQSFKHLLKEKVKEIGSNYKLLIFLDYSINDAFESVEVFKQVNVNFFMGLEYVMQFIIKSIREIDPNSGIIGLTLLTQAQVRIIWHIYDNVFQYMNVPHIQLPLIEYLTRKTFWYWKSKTHPDKNGHIYIGNIVTRLLHQSVCAKQKITTRFDMHTKFPTCDPPIDYYSSYDNSTLYGNCQLYEDRPNKPGYICNGSQSLIVPLNFGSFPILLISFLQSYEGIDDAELILNGVSMKLMGNNHQHVSQTHTLFYYASANDNQQGDETGMQGFGIKPFTKHINATIRPMNQGKIKIISIISC